MGFFFSRAKLLLSNYTSALGSLCNAWRGGPGCVCASKGLLSKPAKARRDPGALASAGRAASQGQGPVPDRGVWGVGWHCHGPQQTSPGSPCSTALMVPWADPRDPRLRHWEEEAWPVLWGVQLFFSFSAHSPPASVMDIWSYALQQSPCIIWSFLHTGLTVSLHDLGHTTEIFFLMPFLNLNLDSMIQWLLNVCCWFCGQSNTFLWSRPRVMSVRCLRNMFKSFYLDVHLYFSSILPRGHV